MKDLNRVITLAKTSLYSQLEKQPKDQSKFTIYRVHRHLRDVNCSAYEPEVIAIGPYHRGKDHLKMMEDHKLHTLQLLVERKGCDIMEYAAAVGGLESKARKCYADQDFELSELEFIVMLVLDGCFIIELARKFGRPELREEDDPIFQMEWMLCSLQRDLMLFENQVPFFVLLKLFDLIKDPNEDCALVQLLSNLFSSLYPGSGRSLSEEALQGSQEMMHLLDLIHCTWLPPSQESYCSKRKVKKWDTHTMISIRALSRIPVRKETKEFEFIYCATRLKGANVKFEMKEAATLFDIGFKDGIMVMPPLRIEDRTECFLRNLIAYEQYFQPPPHNFVTHYMKVLDSLINSSKDVEILSRNRIITNWQGDDEVVANMVNRLGDSITCPKDCFNYAEIFDEVNEHCRKPKNKWMAKLRRDYLHSPWAIISILAALLLLLLTVVQTVFTILQVLQNK